MTPRIEEGHQLARQTERDGTPSITLASVAVGMMRASLRSAELSGAQYPASVRSRPPIITSMFRSTNLLEDVATLGRMTGSIEHFLFPAWEEFPFPARGDKAAQSSQAIHRSHENPAFRVITQPAPVEPAKDARNIACRLQPNRREKTLPVHRGNRLSGGPDVRRRQPPGILWR
jgi:hypothetical protein